MSLSERPYLRSIRLKREEVYDFEEYPFNIPIIKTLDELEFHPDVTFFVGENGSGKSTLIEAIAAVWGFNPEGGTKNSYFATAKTHSPLNEYLETQKSYKKPKDGFFLRAESFYNLATYMDNVGYLKGYGDLSLHQQSHGESFIATILNKFKGNGLYLLDEPEAALSPTRQMSAISAIHQLVESNSQFIIATHSPILLSYPNARILQLGPEGFETVAYTETEHYAITKQFLNNHKKLLDILLSGEDVT